MSRITEVFHNKKAFIPFITAGDPNLIITEQLVLKMAAAGADLIELGIPFSDPVAEGPVIQQADYRALEAGTTTDKIFDMVERIRGNTSIPMAFMTYANPIFTYGVDRFMSRCNDVNIDAVIVPDIPFEEREELQPYCDKHGITFIYMVAPTSSDRVKMIVQEAQGFLYCVSSMGVTGERTNINSSVGDLIKQVKEVNDIPCAIGFGISTPEQASSMAAISDGVIVGSAIVRLVGEHGVDCVPYVEDYVRSMKEAIL